MKRSDLTIIIIAVFLGVIPSQAQLVQTTVTGPSNVCPNEVAGYLVSVNIDTFKKVWAEVTNGVFTANNSNQIVIFPPGTEEFFVGPVPLTVRWNNQNGITGTLDVSGYWKFLGLVFSDDALVDVPIGSPPVGQFTAAYVASCGEDVSGFTIAPVVGATSYEWENTLGWTTGSTGPTGSFNSMTSTISGAVKVTAINSNCNISSNRTISVSRDAYVPFISGDDVVPPNNNETFLTVKGSNFDWTQPSGWTNMGSQGNFYMQIQAPSYSSSGYVHVSYLDACGNPGEASKFVSTEPYEENFRHGRDEEFLVFPNPTSDRLFVEHRFQTPYKVIIKTEAGEVVQSSVQSQNNATIDLEKLKEGRYFVEIVSGKKSTTKRFVVKRN